MKLHQVLLSIPVVTLTLLAAPSQAQTAPSQPNYSAYNYLGIGINDHDNGDSLVLEGSYAFKAPYFVSGYYRNFDNDAGGSNDAFNIKLGRYFWLNNGLTADFGVRAGHVDFGPVDSNFYGVEGNLRQRINQFEIYGGIGWIDYTDGGSDNQYQVGVNYYLDTNLSIGVGYQDSEYGDGIRFRGSYHF